MVQTVNILSLVEGTEKTRAVMLEQHMENGGHRLYNPKGTDLFVPTA